jgi:predicted nucleic acid-binding protein
MVNAIQHLAITCDPLPLVELSPDPDDDWLLAVAQVSSADYLVTSDKSDLLALRHY